MITQQEIILIIGMMAVTFLARYPLLVLVGRVELPQRAFQALRYVPVAVLTAIIVPAAVMPQGTVDISLSNAYFYGGIVSLLMAWRTKNLLATIIVGMVFFLVWQVIF